MNPKLPVFAHVDIKSPSIKNGSLRSRSRSEQAERPNAKILTATLIMLAFSGATPATSVVIFRTPQEIVVAADSLTRGTDNLSGLPTESTNATCKVVRIGNVTFFASSGINRDDRTGFDVRQIAKGIAEGTNSAETLARFEAVFVPALRDEAGFMKFRFPMVYQKNFVEDGPSAVVFMGFESGSTFVHARAYQMNASLVQDDVRTALAYGLS